MAELIETIKISGRQIQNIEYHNERFNRTRKDLFGITVEIDLQDSIGIPEEISDDVYKCRVTYGKEILAVEFVPYIPKKVNSLKLVVDSEIDYAYKYKDRKHFEDLLSGVKEDEILIVKNGCITDTSYSNIAFYDGAEWITPTTYLLNGTKRRQLLDSGIIREEIIRVSDVHRFQSCKLINAMLDWDESPVVWIDFIVL